MIFHTIWANLYNYIYIYIYIYSRCKISTDTVYNTLKTHTKYAHISHMHIVHSRATLKDVERFPNRSVRKPCERSLYERTFMSEPFIEKNAIQLSYLMLIERSIDANLIVYVDVIVNQAEYRYEVWKC